MAEDRELKKNQ